VGVKDLAVVRGYKKEAVNLPNVKYFDNDDFASTQEVSSLAAALEALEGDVIVSYGDVLLKKYIVQELTETDDDIVIMVDSDHHESATAAATPTTSLLRAELAPRLLQHRHPQGLPPRGGRGRARRVDGHREVLPARREARGATGSRPSPRSPSGSAP
jgi:hypothetical protein